MAGKRILIAGYGRIGQRLGKQLTRAGHTVFGLRRTGSAEHSDIPIIQADLQQANALRTKLPSPIDQVYYILTPTEYTDRGYQQAYVDGLSHLLGAISANPGPLPRVMFVSSTSVYGQTAGEWVDESSETQPQRFSGKRLLQAEQLANDYSGEFVSIRFSGIYGPGREQLLKRVQSGGACQAQPPLYTNRIHEADCVGVLEHIGQLAVPAPCYLASDSTPVTQCEIMHWLAEQLGAPAPEPSHGESAGRRCSNKRLNASGYRWIYPDFRSGYQSLINDAHGPDAQR